MPLLFAVAGLVSSVGTFLKRACASSLARGRTALTFTPGKEPDAIIYPLHPLPSSLLKDGAGICHYSLNLKQGYYFYHLPSFLPLYATTSSSIILFSGPLFIFLPSSGGEFA